MSGKSVIIGIDTSNYTTSVAIMSTEGEIIANLKRPLKVKPGERGLRQSDALFAHTQNMPDIMDEAHGYLKGCDIKAIGVSRTPRNIEGSYMPCFLAGLSVAKSISATTDRPIYYFSHQCGHIMAAIHSSGCYDLLENDFAAFHISGGTTELLLVEPEGKNVRCTRIGGTSDISAGQLIDRTGKMLELPFPSGKYVDELSKKAAGREVFRVKCPEMEFSLSGVQNKVQQFHAKQGNDAETAAYALRCVAKAVYLATEQARKAYPGLPVVFSGGVASNSLLRKVIAPLNPVFAQPQFSTDNAMGTAVLAYRMTEE
jgi:N6-L-threonylcarbamoyladenine synthase